MESFATDFEHPWVVFWKECGCPVLPVLGGGLCVCLEFEPFLPAGVSHVWDHLLVVFYFI